MMSSTCMHRYIDDITHVIYTLFGYTGHKKERLDTYLSSLVSSAKGI